jgi:hypothetical protein
VRVRLLCCAVLCCAVLCRGNGVPRHAAAVPPTSRVDMSLLRGCSARAAGAGVCDDGRAEPVRCLLAFGAHGSCGCRLRALALQRLAAAWGRGMHPSSTLTLHPRHAAARAQVAEGALSRHVRAAEGLCAGTGGWVGGLCTGAALRAAWRVHGVGLSHSWPWLVREHCRQQGVSRRHRLSRVLPRRCAGLDVLGGCQGVERPPGGAAGCNWGQWHGGCDRCASRTGSGVTAVRLRGPRWKAVCADLT